jgi:hypothetical protein
MNTVASAALAVGLAAANAQTMDKQRAEPGQQAPSTAQQKKSGGAETGTAQQPRIVGPGQSEQRSEPAQTDDGAKSAQGSGSSEEKSGQAAGGEREGSQPAKQSQEQQPAKEKTTTTQKKDDTRRGERSGSPSPRESDRAQKRDDNRSGDRAAGQGRSEGQSRSADRPDSDRSEPARLSERDRTTIRERFDRERNLNVVSDIDIDINIGAAIPRSVRLAPLPAAIVAVAPAYRGYQYVVVQDEIVIVHPRTYRVVAVIPAEGRAQARTGARSSARVQLSAPQRARILSYARSECTTVLAESDFDLAVGVRIPQQIELCPFEDVVVSEVDVVRPYRFFVVRNQVVLVDPSDHTIVEVIR